ncbi:hypothetical protein MJ1HA_1348 [Metallosphaera sedula]|nr:hypothetical protein MJ1HA_1348 [Metallosphaera sedula]
MGATMVEMIIERRLFEGLGQFVDLGASREK